MIDFSKFTHFYELNDDIALYNSLRMKPVYLQKEKYLALKNILNQNYDSVSDFPVNIKPEVDELCKYKILVDSTQADEKLLQFVRSKIPEPEVNVCYFILTEQCNLACRYCFLGNSNDERRKLFSKEMMTKETAEQGIQFFIRQLSLGETENRKPVIIFYGGEPLINFEILEYVVLRINELESSVPVLENTEFSIVTNGLLLSKDRLLKLKALGVSIAISIDGCTEKANEMRVDVQGKPVFDKIINSLQLAKENNVPVSLSITLTEETIKSKGDILKLINDYGIKGIGFNIMMSDAHNVLSDSYSETAAQFIIDMFVELREIGIYEDRIMRKLKSFANAQPYFSDCAATSAGQIVISSNGEIGICHGCLAERQYFITNVNDLDFNHKENTVYKEWSKLSPVLKDECLSCEALGICGGGCPINAINSDKTNNLHSLDTRFCIHAKKTLEFLISDLYRIVSGKKAVCKKI